MRHHGVPQFRNYHLNLLGEEGESFKEQLDNKTQDYPETVPVNRYLGRAGRS